jgi:hypothetical protein
MRIGIYLDLNDIYHRVKKLDYGEALERLKILYPGEYILRAYGIRNDVGFFACLKRLGFEVKHQPFTNWACGITLNVIRDNCDTVILGSGNAAFRDLCEYRDVVVFSQSPSQELKWKTFISLNTEHLKSGTGGT